MFYSGWVLTFIYGWSKNAPLTFDALKSISTQHLFHDIERMNAFGMQYACSVCIYIYLPHCWVCARAAASKEKNQKSNGSGARRWRQKSLAFKWLFPERERWKSGTTFAKGDGGTPFIYKRERKEKRRVLDPFATRGCAAVAVPAACRKSSCTHPRRTKCWLIVAAPISRTHTANEHSHQRQQCTP